MKTYRAKINFKSLVNGKETMIVKGTLFLVDNIYELPDGYRAFSMNYTSPPREKLYELIDMVIREK